MECGCLHGGVIENGCTRNPLALWTVPVLVRVWVHILGDPQCSAGECYNNNPLFTALKMTDLQFLPFKIQSLQ